MRLRIEWRRVSPYDNAYVLVDEQGNVVGYPAVTKFGAWWQRRKIEKKR